MSDTLILVGSNHKNLELAQAFRQVFEAKGLNPSLVDLVGLNLPLYTPVTEEQAPDAVNQLCSQCMQAKRFVFITPEYNGGIAPALTNAIAWISRSDAADWLTVFNGKMAAMGSVSGGGGLHALMALRMQLGYIGLTVLGRQVVVNAHKPLNESAIQDIADAFITEPA
jgi:NAD(P)H-dependent FMN reductase